MLNHKNMHIQKPFPCEKYVTNTTIKSLPPRFSSPLPFLLFAQPWPPFFLSETETKLYWVNLKQRQYIYLFTIWKMQSERIHLIRFCSDLVDVITLPAKC